MAQFIGGDAAGRRRGQGLKIIGAIALIVGLALPACGDDGGDDTTTGAGADLAGLEVSGVAASAFAGSPDQAAVLDGSPARGAGKGLRLVDANGTSTEHPLPVDEAMVYLRAWWGTDSLHMTGVRCPAWTEAAAPRAFDPDQAGFLDELCGEPVLLAASWNASESTWSPPLELGPAPSAYLFPSSAGDKALLSVPDDPLATVSELLVLDAKTGASTPVPGPPLDATTFCIDQDGQILAVEAFNPTESPAPEPGSKESPALPSLSVLVFDGAAWSERAADPPIEAVEGCSGDGGVVAIDSDRSAGLLRDEDGRLVATALPEPAEGVNTIEPSLTGELLLIQDDEANSDAAQTEQFWVLRDGEWIDLGRATHATGDDLVVLGDRVLTLPRGETPLQSVTLRDA